MYELVDKTGKNFVVVFSTMALLRNATGGNGRTLFHLDCCFEVTKEGFDFLVVAEEAHALSHALLPLATGVLRHLPLTNTLSLQIF